MSPKNRLSLFWYYLNERHRIYLKKEADESKPWTDDPIFQRYKFTNVFRQLDRVTQEYTMLVADRYRSLLAMSREPSIANDLVFPTIGFRMFNWPDTYGALRPLFHGKWSEHRAHQTLTSRKREGHQVFTGAYIVTNGGSSRPKIDLYCEALTVAYKRREEITTAILARGTLQNCCEVLKDLPMIGNFVAYEIACDLRWTPLLERAPDINHWANVGPGAIRGLHWIYGEKPSQKDALDQMIHLLDISPRFLEDHVPPLELREIEHSLCELFKYVKVKEGRGRPRSTYPGV